MAKKNPVKEFVEGLAQLDSLEHDPVIGAVDRALTARIKKYYPKGFKLSRKRRDLAINMLKKSIEIAELVKSSPFKTYLNAVIDLKWTELKEDFDRRAKKGEKVDELVLLRNFALEVFSLGYALKSLEDKEKEKNDKGKNNTAN